MQVNVLPEVSDFVANSMDDIFLPSSCADGTLTMRKCRVKSHMYDIVECVLAYIPDHNYITLIVKNPTTNEWRLSTGYEPTEEMLAEYQKFGVEYTK